MNEENSRKLDVKYVLRRFGNQQELAAAAADEWIRLLQRSHSQPCVAISGGRIAPVFFDELVRATRDAGVSHQTVHFFWADERCVPPDSPESNYPAALSHLLQPLAIPAAHIHRIRGEAPPEVAAVLAERELTCLERFRTGEPAFDLVFLGVGEDGHVASLFPDQPPELSDTPRVYRAVIGPKPPPQRITVGYPILKASAHVLVLASGEGKAKALSDSLSGAPTPLGTVLASRSKTLIFSDIKP